MISKQVYIITRIIHAIAALILLTLGCFYLYWGLVPVEDDEKSMRGLLIIPAAILLVISVIPILSLFALKQRHSKALHYIMAAISITIMLGIWYLSSAR